MSSDWCIILKIQISLRSVVDDQLNDRIMKRSTYGMKRSSAPYAMLARYQHALQQANLLRKPQERDLSSAIYGTTDDINDRILNRSGILNYHW